MNLQGDDILCQAIGDALDSPIEMVVRINFTCEPAAITMGYICIGIESFWILDEQLTGFVKGFTMSGISFHDLERIEVDDEFCGIFIETKINQEFFIKSLYDHKTVDFSIQRNNSIQKIADDILVKWQCARICRSEPVPCFSPPRSVDTRIDHILE